MKKKNTVRDHSIEKQSIHSTHVVHACAVRLHACTDDCMMQILHA